MSFVDSVRDVMRLPDLRRRVLLTIGLLVLYRVAANIPVPGVDRVALANAFDPTLSGTAGFGAVLDLLSGGAVANFSVLAMGVYPYITASIIIQILTPFVPALEELQKQGQQGRNVIEKWTMVFSIPLALFQAVSQINIFRDPTTGMTVIDGWGTDGLTTAMVLITMTAGTLFAIWIGELITKDGIGNGLSLIIFAGIVSQIPQSIGLLFVEDVSAQTFTLAWADTIRNVGLFVVITLLTLFVVVIVQEGQRRIPVKYGKRVRGMKMYGGGSTYLPLRVNTAGMIPLIFAQAILTFPAVLGGFFLTSQTPAVANAASALTNIFGSQGGLALGGRVTYWVVYFFMVVGFTYLYTSIMIKNQNLAENLQRNGGFIPGVRPGKKTEEFINKVVNRITLVGALFLGILAILPGVVAITLDLIEPGSGLQLQTALIIVGGGGLIIVVGVVLDTMRQLEAQLVMRNRESFIR